jgi:hypothetical protein
MFVSPPTRLRSPRGIRLNPQSNQIPGSSCPPLAVHPSVPAPTVASSPRPATVATETPRLWRSVTQHSARPGCAVFESFSTQDLYVAAACLIDGHSVTVVRLDNGCNRFDFPTAASQTAQAYELGSTGPLLVSPMPFAPSSAR